VVHVAPPLSFSRALPRNVGNHLLDFFRNLESGKVVDRKRYDRRFHGKSFVRIHSKWKKGLMVNKLLNLLFIPLIVKCEEFFFYTDVCVACKIDFFAENKIIKLMLSFCFIVFDKWNCILHLTTAFKLLILKLNTWSFIIPS
jgi:hypothetical protein